MCANYCARLVRFMQPLCNVWLIGYSDSRIHDEIGVAQVPKICTPVCLPISDGQWFQQEFALDRAQHQFRRCQALRTALIHIRVGCALAGNSLSLHVAPFALPTFTLAEGPAQI